MARAHLGRRTLEDAGPSSCPERLAAWQQAAMNGAAHTRQCVVPAGHRLRGLRSCKGDARRLVPISADQLERSMSAMQVDIT